VLCIERVLLLLLPPPPLQLPLHPLSTLTPPSQALLRTAWPHVGCAFQSLRHVCVTCVHVYVCMYVYMFMCVYMCMWCKRSPLHVFSLISCSCVCFRAFSPCLKLFCAHRCFLKLECITMFSTCAHHNAFNMCASQCFQRVCITMLSTCVHHHCLDVYNVCASQCLFSARVLLGHGANVNARAE